MINKQTIIGIAAMFLLVMGYWYFLVHVVYKNHPNWDYAGKLNQPAQTTSVREAAPSPGPTSSPTTMTSIGPATMGASLSIATTQPVGSGASAAPAMIGSTRPSDPAYVLGLQIVPQGASLGSVTINSYKDIDAN